MKKRIWFLRISALDTTHYGWYLMSSFIIIFLFLGVKGVFALDPKVLELQKKEEVVFKPPRLSTYVFENGLRLYFLENHELPTFQMHALIHGGSIHEPADKKGLVSIMMEGLATGGSTKRSGDEIDESLEQVAARLSANTRLEYSEFEIEALSPNTDLAISLFFELLRSPRFDQTKLELIRENKLESIRRRNEEPSDIGKRKFRQILYGPESVWARVSTEETVRSITREEILKYHQERVAPNEIWLAVSGDITLGTLVAKIRHHMGDWKRKKISFPQVPPVEKKWEPSVRLIHKPVNQSYLMMGHFGDKRFNPDKYAITLANFILGGSTLTSRLGTRIRSELGLSYSVYSNFGLETDVGLFQMMVGTKSQSTLQVILESKKIFEDVVRGTTITEEELDFSKKTILNQIVFQYEDPFEMVKGRAYYDFYGYPPNYLKIFQSEIKKVTIHQVKAVYQNYFFPDQLVILIVGDREKSGDFNIFGPVQEMPLDLN